jgi:hypothetical protein
MTFASGTRLGPYEIVAPLARATVRMRLEPATYDRQANRRRPDR